MKNIINKISARHQEASGNRVNVISKIIISFMLLLAFGFNTPTKAQTVGISINIPFWAPAYDNVEQVQYYYLPDIEAYYDVYNHEFIYLDDGNWVFAPQLPPSYSWFDFNTAYVVVLDANVHQPWMYYHYYVAHYPRYYYRSVYGNAYNDHDRPVRGFNENARTVVYTNREGRHVDDRREFISRDRVQPSRPPMHMGAFGRPVGQPVKVEKQMRRPKEDRHGDRQDNHHDR